MIPKNLKECFDQLNKILSSKEIQDIKDGKINLHHTLGRCIRNNWELWNTESPSQLTKYFNHLGIFHPDDMSGIILKSYYRKLNNLPLQLREQIRFYKDFWIKTKNNNYSFLIKENRDIQFID